MAEEKKEGGGPVSDFWLVVLGLVGLVILWFATGGPQRADLRGIFLQPPAPLGGGNAYGPQIGSPTATTTDSTDTTYTSNTDYSNYNQ